MSNPDKINPKKRQALRQVKEVDIKKLTPVSIDIKNKTRYLQDPATGLMYSAPILAKRTSPDQVWYDIVNDKLITTQ